MSRIIEWGDQPADPLQGAPRERLFDKNYFDGGRGVVNGVQVGGYSREGYRDFACHEVTARHVLARKPTSVLEIGCARGYVLKKLQDAGVRACGLEISRHCWLTRACEGVINLDICTRPWPYKDGEFDLCYSVATLEHIPEEFLPHVLSEMARVSQRGLHGIDFGGNDDGFDRTHVTLRHREWWVERFLMYARSGRDRQDAMGVEIIDKEELERGEVPREVFEGDGKLKLNVGSFTNMFYHGWTNLDLVNLEGFARQNGYRFLHHDCRKAMPFNTGTVDLIFSSHFLEHLTYREGAAFLRDCRRVLKPGGAMRLIVPDAEKLCGLYAKTFLSGRSNDLDDLEQISDFSDKPTPLMKLWGLLMDGHQSAYDAETLVHALEQAGFSARATLFRERGFGIPPFDQIRREAIDMFPEFSLFVDAVPQFD